MAEIVWPATDLTEYDAMSNVESRAFRGWFRGGSSVAYWSGDGGAFMGKSECESVPFGTFWIGKMNDLGWFEVRNIDGNQYSVNATQIGSDVYDAWLSRERIRSMCRTIGEFSTWIAHGELPWWARDE